MATFGFVHGAGDVGAAWEGVARELRARGHRTAAPDLPCDDPEAGLDDYADAIVTAVGEARADSGPVVLVAHSLGGFFAPLAAARLGAGQLVFVTAMVPLPGETADAWWGATGFPDATAHLAGLDELERFLHDVPHEQAVAALAAGRDQAEKALAEPFPLDGMGTADVRFLLCRDDRFFPPAFMRAVVRERLDVEPEEIDGSHCVHLSRPAELAERLDAGLPR
ncbi:alpha/beta hydrolase [Conexibacter sp. JD483]|uniref:alpha/beta fold hydrolase n=1 Tax=unclassified Conexibacter TaxID=2627773 RepID=UPI0027164275|nr:MULTISPECIES: alpha/beta hydrolase [unclassified Conexibacter]MDO8189006.1 alpha/beta hydrolase [Conexibacter sp. CPCC 205706]MDO8201406.1 alpha/beta hydrolase [Conexibacter sp. CPCC 205762]MDR9371707.1 alpha/beta hydrolase [Conexibacter sp. JD483]